MKKRFIVLVDFSEYSFNLLKYAYQWSKQVNAELLLVHQTGVLTPSMADSASKEILTQHANKEALQKMKELIDTTLAPGAKVSYLVSESRLLLTLQKLLRESFENLIFVGLKGTGLLKKIFIGSVAIRVIDNTDNIIVAIPKDITSFSHEKFFVGVTEKHPLNILELNNFLHFLDKDKTNTTFFYLAKPYEKTQGIEKKLKDLCKLFSDRFNTTYTIYEGYNSFTEIKKVINNKSEEILIVQKGSRFLKDELFRKFMINELVYEGQTPLIVLP